MALDPLRTLLVGFTLCAVASAQAGSEPVPVGFVGSPDSSSYRGADLGVEESNRQGRYFGRELTLVAGHPDERPEIALWIAALPADGLEALAANDRVILSVAAPENRLRTACRPGVYFVDPSQAMLDRALSSANPAGGVRPEAWHESLVKYAARDLNKRYRARSGIPMDSAAWAGWAAARILGDAYIRTGDAGAPSIDTYLEEELAFDGQKGVALHFNSARQLLQVIFLVEGDRVAAEVPRGKETAAAIADLATARCPEEEP